MDIMQPAAKIFWPRVAMSDGCWEFAGLSRNGSGRSGVGHRKFWRNGRKVYAHRFSWELHYGPIPDGMQVLHSCDNPPCVRPDHLFLGTTRDNMADAASKGRTRNGGLRGESHPRAKLNNRDVNYIRATYIRGLGGNSATLAHKFGVHQATISRICNRGGWPAAVPLSP